MFEVRWTGQARGLLADLWSRAEDREAVTRAVHSMDILMKDTPHTLGESRSGDERIMFVPPLVVRFRVAEDDRLVTVFAIALSRRR